MVPTPLEPANAFINPGADVWHRRWSIPNEIPIGQTATSNQCNLNTRSAAVTEMTALCITTRIFVLQGRYLALFLSTSSDYHHKSLSKTIELARTKVLREELAGNICWISSKLNSAADYQILLKFGMQMQCVPHHVAKFHGNRPTYGWVIDDLAHFRSPLLEVGHFLRTFLRSAWIELH